MVLMAAVMVGASLNTRRSNESGSSFSQARDLRLLAVSVLESLKCFETVGNGDLLEDFVLLSRRVDQRIQLHLVERPPISHWRGLVRAVVVVVAIEKLNHTVDGGRVIVLELQLLATGFREGSTAALGEVFGVRADDAPVDLVVPAGADDGEVGELVVVLICGSRGAESFHGVEDGLRRGRRISHRGVSGFRRVCWRRGRSMSLAWQHASEAGDVRETLTEILNDEVEISNWTVHVS